jgi:hypothetical protein
MEMTRVVIFRGMQLVERKKKERPSQMIDHVGAEGQKATTRASSGNKMLACST